MVNDMVDKRVILETDRLQLREMRMSDLAALSVMLQDEIGRASCRERVS